MTDPNAWISFSCVEVQQPLGTFYVGVLDHDDLLAISYADVRRIDERDIEKYLGIQRPLDRKRVAELQSYVKTIDAAFPGNILLAIPSSDSRYFPEEARMEVRRDEAVAKIIDGQHRIAGLRASEGIFQSVVAFFVDMDIEDQANMFATINLKQTKVNRSLAYDLFEFAKARSPQKTAHNIARLLNFEKGSPLLGRIKLLGVASAPRSGETLTQALVVEETMRFITTDPMKDRDDLRRGLKLEPVESGEMKRLPFRNLFIAESDAVIARNIWNFFDAVDGRWPNSWRNVEPGFILNRTTGFTALMRFLGVLHGEWGAEGVVESQRYREVLDRVEISEEEFNRDEFLPGTSGINRLLRRLSAALG
ncbi:MAG: DGQHR domain-containing protein [Dehalococcoidia bacterium]|nr:DGQHR domain-containing protein [Dehalococcoidia bacterium]MYK25739.1 DGQHR domain-containing protein [Dehalococcoidia bacterium]